MALSSAVHATSAARAPALGSPTERLIGRDDEGSLKGNLTITDKALIEPLRGSSDAGIGPYMDASQDASALRVGRIGGLHSHIRPVNAGVVTRWP